jgi:23S rRNA (guanosine2251-2'-O)-methyltransferase
MSITVKNPHSILAAIEKRPNEVLQLNLPSNPSESIWKEVENLAKKNGIRTGGGHKGGRAGTVEAVVKEKESVPLETLFSEVTNGLWLALDCLQDPQNVGAIFRSAAFFGVKGIIITQERSAPMTNTVYDVSSGGVEHTPFTMQTNLQRAFEVAKDRGLWILGTSEHAKEPLKNIKADRPWLLVLGNEEKGMRRLTEERCDVVCTIPNKGKVTSLNVSAAASVLISHLTS